MVRVCISATLVDADCHDDYVTNVQRRLGSVQDHRVPINRVITLQVCVDKINVVFLYGPISCVKPSCVCTYRWQSLIGQMLVDM